MIKIGGKFRKTYSQTTYGFFSEDSKEKGIFPRIRLESGKHVLTVKVRPKTKSKYFERKEYSIIIDNEKEGIKILKLLGFDKIRKFSKKGKNGNFQTLKYVLINYILELFWKLREKRSR